MASGRARARRTTAAELPDQRLRAEARSLLPRSWLLRTDFDALWAAGQRTGLLLAQAESWLHRRVETIAFTDDLRVRRRISLDVCVSSQLGKQLKRAGVGKGDVVVPLAYLTKQPEAANVDLRDDSGVAMSLLTREENSVVTVAALMSVLERVMSSRDVRRVLPAVITLVMGDADEGFDSLQALLESRWLRGREDIQRLLVAITTNSVMWVRLPRERPGHTIIKLGYDQHIDTGQRFKQLRRFPRTFAWRELEAFVLVHVGDARSYHLQLIAPDGLEIRDTILRAASSDQDHLDGVVQYRLDASVAQVVAKRARPVHPTAVGVRLHPGRRGVVTATLVMLTFIALLLTGAFLGVDALNRQNQVATSLLLLIPGLALSAGARPREHPLASMMLAGSRFTLLLGGVATGLAAGAFALFGAADSDSGLADRRLVICLGILSLTGWLLSASAFAGLLRAIKPPNRIVALAVALALALTSAAVAPLLGSRGHVVQRGALAAAAALMVVLVAVSLTALNRYGHVRRDRARRQGLTR